MRKYQLSKFRTGVAYLLHTWLEVFTTTTWIFKKRNHLIHFHAPFLGSKQNTYILFAKLLKLFTCTFTSKYICHAPFFGKQKNKQKHFWKGHVLLKLAYQMVLVYKEPLSVKSVLETCVWSKTHFLFWCLFNMLYGNTKEKV